MVWQNYNLFRVEIGLFEKVFDSNTPDQPEAQEKISTKKKSDSMSQKLFGKKPKSQPVSIVPKTKEEGFKFSFSSNGDIKKNGSICAQVGACNPGDRIGMLYSQEPDMEQIIFTKNAVIIGTISWLS